MLLFIDISLLYNNLMCEYVASQSRRVQYISDKCAQKQNSLIFVTSVVPDANETSQRNWDSVGLVALVGFTLETAS